MLKLLAAVALASITLVSTAFANCESSHIDAGGYALWAHAEGAGPVTVVFESGNGAHSADWAGITPAIRDRGARTLVYDRAGLGQSEPSPNAYSIDAETEAMRRVLDACAVSGPVVFVAHSYGGFIALLAANTDPRIAGIVLADASVVNYFTDAAAQAIVAEYEPRFPELEQGAPALARVLIPVIRAFPATSQRLRALDYPAGIPVIDITTERTWLSTPEAQQAWRASHADFVAAAPASREALYAAGSGHNVMRDRPDVVIDAITRMVARVQATP